MADRTSEPKGIHYVGVVLAVAVVFLGITYRADVDVAAKTAIKTAASAQNAAPPVQASYAEVPMFEYLPLR